ncbi:probable sodium/metabolite cotransporter BASS4, chloroplastic [Amaranthus tricolor]|uniref:probable sodium/metabolite cotransporter BASS4, chloroplastic n=1 Tax=Amaranthus tricolor TaxID=29722 RepID=UPI00258382B5|nr:probable sodium/metabolite cotransporter BASS4, chloroplastic [Amaranthus tricolor]XP_057536583.1 probable sodium/metabolite cotransporter BASS4, chloroplastic [Amaranthus tricolor]
MAGTSLVALYFKPSLSPCSFPPPKISCNSKFPNDINFRSCSNSLHSIQNPSFFQWKPKLNSSRIKAAASSSQPQPANDGGNKQSGDLLKWVRPCLEIASNNFLPLALIGGVFLGLAYPSLGCFVDRYYLSKVSTFCIFIISGLTLRSQEIGAAKEAWPVGIFGLASILLLTPAFARLILQLNLQPPEFVTGLAIFACMPTTLSSGVSLTLLAGGNFALALAMTVISNLLGILVVPFTITKLVAAGVGISIPTKQLLRSLVVTLLIPLMLGKIVRESFNGVAHFADNNRKLLSNMNALFLGLVPWIQVSKSRSLLLMVNPTSFLLAIGLGVILHFTLLAFNALAIKIFSSISGGKSVFANKRNAVALILVASQKTLPVMVAVVDKLGGAFGAPGLLILPCIAAHLNQIILDSFLVNSLLRSDHVVHPAKGA